MSKEGSRENGRKLCVLIIKHMEMQETGLTSKGCCNCLCTQMFVLKPLASKIRLESRWYWITVRIPPHTPAQIKPSCNFSHIHTSQICTQWHISRRLLMSSSRLQALPIPPYAEVRQEDKWFMETAPCCRRSCPQSELGSYDGRVSSPQQVHNLSPPQNKRRQLSVVQNARTHR